MGGRVDMTGETQVTDLTPLGGVPLQRLIFNPGKITKGIGLIREKTSINEIGPSFKKRMPPQQFWELFDRGDFK